jgi:hypothetical protein
LRDHDEHRMNSAKVTTPTNTPPTR